MINSKDDQHLWDQTGNVEASEAFDQKFGEWERRDWLSWLAAQLKFPFTAVREEDQDDLFYDPDAAKALFRLGHTMKILGIELNDDLYGIVVRVREKGRMGFVPLCDLKVKPETDSNYWPVREYVLWFANR